ncbi:MAG TPA: response regulator transcription factor [Ramlibacter sp.]|nr:response regulator transcription factor [Ramlibacter sp.]
MPRPGDQVTSKLMHGRRIAIVEDDPIQQDLLLHVAKSGGAVAQVFPAGEKLLKVLPRETFDLLIVDWALPGIQGPEIVKAVRANSGSAALPILFVTSRAHESDVVAGLSAGADDYVTKPVRPAELAARMQALLRRAYPAPADDKQRSYGPFTFDLVQRQAAVDGEIVDLQPREFDLALFLFNNVGRLLSRSHLAEGVLNASPAAVSRSLDTHVSRLRTKLGIGPARGFRLASVYGVGYRLEMIEA